MTKMEAYQAWCAADEAWHAELVKVYGKRAGDARYDKRGVATEELLRLHNAFCEAGHVWVEAPIAKREAHSLLMPDKPEARCSECQKLHYKCPKCYMDSCLCGGVGCTSCEPRGSY